MNSSHECGLAVSHALLYQNGNLVGADFLNPIWWGTSPPQGPRTWRLVIGKAHCSDAVRTEDLDEAAIDILINGVHVISSADIQGVIKYGITPTVRHIEVNRATIASKCKGERDIHTCVALVCVGKINGLTIVICGFEILCTFAVGISGDSRTKTEYIETAAMYASTRRKWVRVYPLRSGHVRGGSRFLYGLRTGNRATNAKDA